MTRLMLLIVLGIVTSLYFPESRAVVLDFAEPVITPFYVWKTQSDMRDIAAELRVYERENYGQIPDTRRFGDWLDQKFSGSASRDAWGGSYHLYVQRDSFSVTSFGPDGLPRTEDDIHETRPLARPRRRR